MIQVLLQLLEVKKKDYFIMSRFTLSRSLDTQHIQLVSLAEHPAQNT